MGLFGDLIDAISISTTTFGVCTSLGLGVSQLSSGLQFVKRYTGATCAHSVFAHVHSAHHSVRAPLPARSLCCFHKCAYWPSMYLYPIWCVAGLAATFARIALKPAVCGVPTPTAARCATIRPPITRSACAPTIRTYVQHTCVHVQQRHLTTSPPAVPGGCNGGPLRAPLARQRGGISCRSVHQCVAVD